MKACNGATQFSFDFTRSGRVSWTHGRQNAARETIGMPANFAIDDQEIASRFAQAVEPAMADFVDIAIAVHIADRLAVRTLDAPSNWSRRLRLKISVRNPERWNDNALRARLETLLASLTEDAWTLEFVLLCDPRRGSEIQSFLFPRGQDGDSSASLFSGGLDSLAGTTAALSDQTNRHFILISASPNFRQRSQQQQQVEILRRELGVPISHVSIPYGMRDGDHYAQEPSRRTRGFLFLVLGSVAATAAGCPALHLYENGLGAINLPYDQSQIGTDNARAVHPRVLRQVAELLSTVADKPFLIVNPCIYLTKAEILQHPSIGQIPQAVALTFSCDGFPVRTKGQAQCGSCTSCLLRRFSLEIAALDHLDTHEYLRDWRSNSFLPLKHHLRGLRAMDWQVLRFRRCLTEPDPWLALTFEFPELRVLVNDLCFLNHQTSAVVTANLCRLIRQHVTDWPRFSALPLLNVPNTRVA
jgi:7-cyano-7-deazaguanine synthase in queuosine biosynthesis